MVSIPLFITCDAIYIWIYIRQMHDLHYIYRLHDYFMFPMMLKHMSISPGFLRMLVTGASETG